jgi:hypothetical protein
MMCCNVALGLMGLSAFMAGALCTFAILVWAINK